MTTSQNPPATLQTRWQPVLAAVAVLSCVPYVVLKLLWLLGSDLGLNDEEMVGNTTIEVANTLTLLMSLAAAALAVAMVRSGGARLPAWVVLPPMFVGSGLLGAILVLVPIQSLMGIPGAQPRDYPADPIQNWVYVVVYGGFVVLGLCLLPLFAAHAWQRWLTRDRWIAPMGTWGSVDVRLRAVAIAHGGLLVGLCVAEAIAVSTVERLAGNQIVAMLMAGLAFLGLTALAFRRPAKRPGTWPVLAAFVGSAAVAAWGLFFFVILLVPNPIAEPGPELPAGVVMLEAGKAVCGTLTLVLTNRLRPDIVGGTRPHLSHCHRRITPIAGRRETSDVGRNPHAA